MKVDPIQLLRTVGGICGCLVIVIGVLSLLSSGLSPRVIINAIYLIIFGLLMIVCELRVKQVLTHFVFLTHFFGLGMFYIFVGGLCLNSDWWKYAIAAALLAVGIVYMCLGCCNRKMGDESFGSGPAKEASGAPAAGAPAAAEKPAERRFEAQERYMADQIVASNSSGSAYEPAAVTQMKQMAAKKAVEHVVDNNNPFAD